MFQKKILCIGNNSQDTDIQTSKLAVEKNTVNHGIIDQVDFVPAHPGFYHTTVIDLPVGVIHQLADYFDLVILLDQPYEEWSDWKLLNVSYKLLRDLEYKGVNVQYRDNSNTQTLIFFNTVLNENKSFCIHPWINYTNQEDNLKLCPRDRGPVISSTRITNWNNDTTIKLVQQNMLQGKKMPDRCKVCYDYESIGTESYRQYETLEWLLSLNIKSFDDLNKIQHPRLYELRLSNKCNLMCRSCQPGFSHLIAKESKQFNIIPANKKPVNEISKKYSNINVIDIDALQPNSRVYLTGGEPTVMHEVIDFMRRCIDRKKTNFEFTLGTNGSKFSKTFLQLCSHFSKMNFSFSLDGYEKINDYWRWGSNWSNIVKNMHLIRNQGHIISVNTVPGIYNVTNLHLLFEWLDHEFPKVGIYLQFNYFESQSAFNHPNHAMVLDSMKRCQNTKVYLADGKSTKTGIDSIIKHYKQNPTCDLKLLKEFFEFNDQLDHARGSRLADAIPELESCRYLVQS